MYRYKYAHGFKSFVISPSLQCQWQGSVVLTQYSMSPLSNRGPRTDTTMVVHTMCGKIKKTFQAMWAALSSDLKYLCNADWNAAFSFCLGLGSDLRLRPEMTPLIPRIEFLRDDHLRKKNESPWFTLKGCQVRSCPWTTESIELWSYGRPSMKALPRIGIKRTNNFILMVFVTLNELHSL